MEYPLWGESFGKIGAVLKRLEQLGVSGLDLNRVCDSKLTAERVAHVLRTTDLADDPIPVGSYPPAFLNTQPTLEEQVRILCNMVPIKDYPTSLEPVMELIQRINEGKYTLPEGAERWVVFVNADVVFGPLSYSEQCNQLLKWACIEGSSDYWMTKRTRTFWDALAASQKNASLLIAPAQLGARRWSVRPGYARKRCSIGEYGMNIIQGISVLMTHSSLLQKDYPFEFGCLGDERTGEQIATFSIWDKRPKLHVFDLEWKSDRYGWATVFAMDLT